MADALPVRGGVTGSWLTPQNISFSYGASFGGIQRGTGADWFGPQNPMAPAAPPEVASRQWDFPVGYNLATTPRSYEAVGFHTLRSIADGWDILRLIIETRKDQIARMRWTIKARDPKKDTALAAKINTAKDFFERPDHVNSWPDWLRMLMEDLLVVDAPTVYKQRTRGGALYALVPLDGANIVPRLDDWGRTPQPYTDATGQQVTPVAYQHIFKGMPAVDYSVNDLIYRPRNRRLHKAYGYSPVEQIIVSVNIALNRQSFLLDYYREGNVPDSLIGVPETWTPDQIKNWQSYWDSLFVDNLAARRRAKFVPGGVAKTFIQTKEPELKNEFDNWLASIACYAFSVSPQAFQRMMNRATAQTAKQAAEEEGLLPLMGWIKSMMDDLLRAEFNSSDLEFDWEHDEETDEAAQADILTNYLKAGVKTINEVRAELGDEPDPNPAAKMLMVLTPTGYVPIDANTIEGKKAMQAALPAPAPAPMAGGAGAPQIGRSAAKPQGVGKAAGTPFRALKPLDLDRATLAQPRVAMEMVWTAILARHAQVTRDAITATLSEVRKADDPTPDETERGDVWSEERITAEVEAVLDQMEFDLSNELMSSVVSPMANVARDAGLRAVAQALNVGVLLGSDPNAGAEPGREVVGGDIFDHINTRAVAWAKEHAAELVSGVNDVTREAVRSAVSDGLAAGERYTDIIARVDRLKAFSEERAVIIAETEIANANSMGALQGLFQARDAGVDVKKAWLTAGGIERICDRCNANAAAGPIELEAAFPSGDLAPAAHPRCRCSLIPYVEDGAEKFSKAFNPVESRDKRGRWTSGGVLFSGRHSKEGGDEELVTRHGNVRYRTEMVHDEDAKTVNAHVHDVEVERRSLGEDGEEYSEFRRAEDELSPSELKRVQYEIKANVKDNASDAAEDRNDEDDWESLSQGERDKIEADQAADANQIDREHTVAVRNAVDRAVSSGWNGDMSPSGMPEEIKQFASPKSRAKISAHLSSLGLKAVWANDLAKTRRSRRTKLEQHECPV